MEDISMNKTEFWFPGRWIGGTSMIVAPILMLVSQVLLVKFDFFYPYQLKAYYDHPNLLITAYSLYLAGNILLWPAAATIARYVGQKEPMLGLVGGTLVMFGLFARTFHYGINHMAFQLVNVQNLQSATKAIGDSYGAFHVVSTLSAAIMFGWIILAMGTYRSGMLNLIQSICLGLMSGLMLGVLKGASPFSIICSIGLLIAMLALGKKVLTDGQKPSTKNLVFWPLAIIVIITAMYLFGQAG
ncbi:hypothetical protein [Dyadobacter luticola]|uniref:DUF4386 family protein n=1 Tax=Dyadobacter luticola TaxID=1979387 RepID=A0A5R9L3N0_9BACT|nr:hypothetical protein [Dyadobacter luticola]TLV02870.1 hypothetical protein FEN17_04460 [Dyadobacter luticola]